MSQRRHGELAATIDENTATGAMSMTITQGLPTASRVRPPAGLDVQRQANIVSTFTALQRERPARSRCRDLIGRVTFSSNLGTGSCDFAVTLSMTATKTRNSSPVMSGTVCGRSVSQSLSAN